MKIWWMTLFVRVKIVLLLLCGRLLGLRQFLLGESGMEIHSHERDQLIYLFATQVLAHGDGPCRSPHYVVGCSTDCVLGQHIYVETSHKANDVVPIASDWKRTILATDLIVPYDFVPLNDYLRTVGLALNEPDLSLWHTFKLSEEAFCNKGLFPACQSCPTELVE